MILTINQYKLFYLSLYSSQRDLLAHGIHHRHPKESLSERQLTSLLNNILSELLPNRGQSCLSLSMTTIFCPSRIMYKLVKTTI